MSVGRILSQNGKAAVFNDLPISREESGIQGEVDIPQLHLHRVIVVILTIFAGLDYFSQQLADHRPVLLLIAAGTDGKIKPRKIGFVINRDPIVGHVIEIRNPFGFARDRQGGNSLGQTVHLSFPLLRHRGRCQFVQLNGCGVRGTIVEVRKILLLASY